MHSFEVSLGHESVDRTTFSTWLPRFIENVLRSTLSCPNETSKECIQFLSTTRISSYLFLLKQDRYDLMDFIRVIGKHHENIKVKEQHFYCSSRFHKGNRGGSRRTGTLGRNPRYDDKFRRQVVRRFTPRFRTHQQAIRPDGHLRRRRQHGRRVFGRRPGADG